MVTDKYSARMCGDSRYFITWEFHRVGGSHRVCSKEKKLNSIGIIFRKIVKSC
jgi:hypothetical protein